jgi:acetyl esterase/lipase
MKRFPIKLAGVLAGSSFALSRFLAFRVRKPSQLPLMLPKLMVESAAGYLGAIGVAGSLFSLLSKKRVAALLSYTLGILGAATYAGYIRQVLSVRGDFDRIFGPGWEQRIPADTKRRMLKRPWGWRIPPAPEPRWQRDVPFWTIPGRDKPLRCDIWQPPADIPPSGLAFLYFHGSAWHYLDKDLGTRPMFRHLASQGHVIMDVAYRLCPEVDLREMVGDIKRAIVWMKRNGDRYGVNPQKVVVAGGSAGGHLALLAAYTAGDPEFTPEELRNIDTSVLGVISYYGPVDLAALYNYMLQTTGRNAPAASHSRNKLASSWDKLSQKMMGSQAFKLVPLPQIFVNLFGDMPDKVPGAAERGSPINHVQPDCPPTLVFQGEHDALVPVEAARAFYARLKEAGVPALYLELPQTEHAFDLILASVSLPGQVALYNTERFLALLAAKVDGLSEYLVLDADYLSSQLKAN